MSASGPSGPLVVIGVLEERGGSHIIFVRIANREDAETACLLRPYGR